MFVLQALEFFAFYLLSAFVLAIIFGVAMNRQFVKEPPDKWPLVTPVLRATVFFGMFAIFGVAVAYFLSLGLKEDETDLANPLIQEFATPLIALLTAGVTYYARQQAPHDAIPNSETPKPVMTVVVAGVTCFLLESIVSYRAFYLYYLNN